MGAGVATGVAPSKSGSRGYQYIVVVGAIGAAFFGKTETHHPKAHVRTVLSPTFLKKASHRVKPHGLTYPSYYT